MQTAQNPNTDFLTIVTKDRFAINYKGERILTMEILAPGEPKKQVIKNIRAAQRIIRKLTSECAGPFEAERARYLEIKNQTN